MLPSEVSAFAEWLSQLHQPDGVVYAKRPFAGPEQVLEYLGRYTRRVALSNERLLRLDDARCHASAGRTTPTAIA